MSGTIYYFTATGNGLDIARELQASLEETELVSISSFLHANKVTITSDTIGIVFPVYNFGVPLVVRDFIEKLEVEKAKYIFSIATYSLLPGLALECVRNQKVVGLQKSKYAIDRFLAPIMQIEICQQCLACIQWCPSESIQFGKATIKRKRYRNPRITLLDIIHADR